MAKQIVISEQLRIAALLTDERVEELIVAQGRYQIGDVYLGTVENVLPGIDAAFVNIGESEKNGFIHVTDLGPLKLKKAAAGITELLEPRQKVLVQVMKEPTGNKGPRLTGNIALPGRYLVLQPNGQGVNISRKINSENERNRLRALGVLIKPPGAGLLIRTEAENINEEMLIDDLENLLKQWESIQTFAEQSTPPVLLNRDEDFIHRVLRDHLGPDLGKVVVENNVAVEKVNKFLAHDGANVLVQAHIESSNLLEHFKVNAAIRDALKPRVDLPSGGYIIIEPTEALTVIDVNSGSFTRSANARETVLWTNCEAAIEIARQLKLRNIGGVIIIDFIDMDSRRDQLQLLEHFTSAVQNDSARPQIAQLTELGLVELTRKRQGQNIYELFGSPCANCGGLGHVAVLPGKELLEPLATAIGLVRSNSSSRSENNINIELSNGKKKKNSSSKNKSQYEMEIMSSSSEVNIANDSNYLESEGTDFESSNEYGSQKNSSEIILVPMNLEEEEVFSNLGLNPLLLLDKEINNDNLIARIIRPGENSEELILEAKKEIAANANRKRRRGRGSYKINIRTNDESNSNESNMENNNENSQNENKEIIEDEKNNLDFDNDSTEEEQIKEDSKYEQEESQETEDPRRKRRRSSARIGDE